MIIPLSLRLILWYIKKSWRLPLVLALLVVITLAAAAVVSPRIWIAPQPRIETLALTLVGLKSQNETRFFELELGHDVDDTPKAKAAYSMDYFPRGEGGGPYHDWDLFAADYQQMLQHLKIFVYPDVSLKNSSTFPFAHVFLPHPNPFNPKIGNYFSEHVFKVALLRSSLVTRHREAADFYFLPFSINAMRSDPRIRSVATISEFVRQYVVRISSEYGFWNASRGADHFYVCCHSVGREAASKHRELRDNAIQVACSSSYFQRLYVAHKDVGLPQVWPRRHEEVWNPPKSRDRLVFFAGRLQNSRTRKELLALWGNDTSMYLISGISSINYESGFRRSRYCLHVKGYEVNTARVCDAIHYGCIPVLISNYYDLPFANVLDWNKFSIVINQNDVSMLKKILLSVPKKVYLRMYENLRMVRRHFIWHSTPTSYDSFYMTAYQLWLRRGLHRLPY